MLVAAWSLFPAHGACAERPGAISQTCPKTVRSACADPAQGGHFSRAQMQMNRLEFRILGPLTVWVDGVSVPIGGPKQRALLAMLLMSANRVVSRERLTGELFPAQDVESADHALRNHVSRLRKVLRPVATDEPRLVARPPGYLLRPERAA